MGNRLMQILASLAQRRALRGLDVICETQHQISTRKLEQYLHQIDNELSGHAHYLRIEYDALTSKVATLEAENAKLRAGQESLLLNLAEQKRQAVEYREMWAKAAERASAQSSDLSFLSEYIVGREYGTALPNYEALGRYPLDVAEAAIAAARKGE